MKDPVRDKKDPEDENSAVQPTSSTVRQIGCNEVEKVTFFGEIKIRASVDQSRWRQGGQRFGCLVILSPVCCCAKYTESSLCIHLSSLSNPESLKYQCISHHQLFRKIKCCMYVILCGLMTINSVMRVDSSARLVGDSIGDSIGNSVGHSARDGVVHRRWLVDNGVVDVVTWLVRHCIVTGGSTLVGLLAGVKIWWN